LPNQQGANTLDGQPTTRELVAFLKSPECAGESGTVETLETHMSWVFLADQFVYKLKKPIRRPHLDFSTLAAREENCRTEVRLNRRLAANVYIGVTAITLQDDGSLALDGTGRTVDWLVKMRRLPAERMLDAAIRTQTVTRRQIEGVADLLVRFYKSQKPAEISAGTYRARFEQQLQIDRTILCDPRFELPPNLAHKVLQRLSETIRSDPQLIEAAACSGRIVEGHGDLRPEHVCLSDPPVIIDCLEFNRGLRLVDPFDDVAYMALECSVSGASWIGDILLPRLSGGLGTFPPQRLISFYSACRASLRARLSLAHLLDPQPRTPQKWIPLTVSYLRSAERESARAHSDNSNLQTPAAH